MGTRVLTGLFCFASLSLGAINATAGQSATRWQGNTAVSTVPPLEDIGDAAHAVASFDLYIGDAALMGTDPTESDPVENDSVIADSIETDKIEMYPTYTDPIEQDSVNIDSVEIDQVGVDPVETDQ